MTMIQLISHQMPEAYKMDVTGTTQSGEKFTGHFKGLVGKDTRVFMGLTRMLMFRFLSHREKLIKRGIVLQDPPVCFGLCRAA